MAWLAIHVHHLLHISPEADPVKEAFEDIELLLQPIWVGQGNYSIIGIKVRRQFPYRHAKSLCSLLCFRHHRHLVADDFFHNHIEECGGKGLYLGNSVVPIEGEDTVSTGPGRHGKTTPVRPEELEIPGTNPILRDNPEASVPI